MEGVEEAANQEPGFDFDKYLEEHQNDSYGRLNFILPNLCLERIF
jgi:hypothetical protein